MERWQRQHQSHQLFQAPGKLTILDVSSHLHLNSECSQSPLITLLVGKDQMAFKVHEKILTSRSDYFRDMLASTPAPANLNAALNGLIKSSAEARHHTRSNDVMPGIQVTTPDAHIEAAIKPKMPKTSKTPSRTVMRRAPVPSVYLTTLSYPSNHSLTGHIQAPSP